RVGPQPSTAAPAAADDPAAAMKPAAAVLLALLLSPASQHSGQDPQDPVVADGRVATVVDRHGIATVQPAGASRRTPLTARDLLLPRDVVRTPLRGANAVEIAWAEGGGTLLLGPGCTVQFDRRSVTLLAGDCEVDPGEIPVRLRGPAGEDRELRTREVLRAGPDGLRVLT